MTTYSPRLDPCRSAEEGYKERQRYEELGLPVAWIQYHMKGQGSWFAPDEYFWTPDGFFTINDEMSADLLKAIRARTGGCFFDLTLTEQCQLLGVQLDIVKASDLGEGKASLKNVGRRGGTSIESFALEYFKSLGWDGDRNEGEAFHVISEAVREFVESSKVAYHPQEWKTNRKPRVRTKLTSRESNVLDQAVKQLDETQLTWWPPGDRERGVTTPQVVKCWQALGEQDVYRFCERQMLGFNGKGWPDLTLHRNKELRFVEVKKDNDKFTHRQPYWFRNFARPMGWAVKVLNIISTK